MTKNTLTKIAVITSAHGVRGQVKIHALNGDPETLVSYPLTDATGKRPYKLTRHGIKDNLLIASIEGLTDRNEAERLKGTALYAPATALPANAENQWDYAELIGLEARLENGKSFGRVTAVHNFGAGDILDIEKTGGDSEMLPFTDDFVGDIHPKDGYLIVFPPDYLEAKE